MKYTKEKIEDAVKNSLSVSDVLRFFNLKISGGNHHHMKNRIKAFDIDTSHFLGSSYNKNRKPINRLTADDVLIKNRSDIREKASILKRSLIEKGVKYECLECGLGNIWNSKELTLHIDHINGDFLDNRIENLRFLCPNCHTQTENHSLKK